MRFTETLITEAKFATRDRSLSVWILIVLCLSTFSVYFGLAEVKQQHSSVQRLLDANEQDRQANAKKLKDWGSAAYYSFHLTYDPPSEFAFAALGQRDVQPWKHRIRMLALEGQIYERDAGNPVIALIGRFDFAFLAAFVLPLVLIILLYDLRASERTAGRYNLLVATYGQAFSLWLARISVRAGVIFLSLITPLIIAGLISGAGVVILLSASLLVFVYTVFWALLCYAVGAWRKSDSLILMTLIGAWLSFAVILPAGFKLTIDRLVTVPSGAELLLLQRETVNDAWDLPREVTFETFFEQHPEWADYEKAEGAFEWQWYYAFQQVGDQKTQHLTKAYLEGRIKRDRMAGWSSLIAPPALLERSLQSLANTDFKSSMAYEKNVRSFHRALREHYYPKFFRNEAFDKAALESLPEFNRDQGMVK